MMQGRTNRPMGFRRGHRPSAHIGFHADCPSSEEETRESFSAFAVAMGTWRILQSYLLARRPPFKSPSPDGRHPKRATRAPRPP